MEFGDLTFLAPLALLGLLALPLIWWILRVTPPTPKKEVFPPLRILRNVVTDEETPNSTPLWLLLFRLLLAALIAIALAQPFIKTADTETTNDLVLVVDNGWAAAGNWSKITDEAEAHAIEARRANRQVALVTTVGGDETPAVMASAQTAIDALETLTPLPLVTDRKTVASRLDGLPLSGLDVVWLSDGVASLDDKTLTSVLQTAENTTVLYPNSEISSLVPGGVSESEKGFRSFWQRVDTSSLRQETIVAYGTDGRVLARTDISFTPGQRDAEAMFELPTALRNKVSFVKPDGINSAGSVRLMDDSWGRPLVGILRGADENRQPLLSETYYVEKALAPYADIFKGTPEIVLPLSPSILIMTDSARTEGEELEKFVDDGGLLLRFAGPRLAARGDDLLPVEMRRGGRNLGGALAWETPQNLAPFENESPFFGLPVSEDITVSKQLMAEAGTETDNRTWARLADGSPVVTASTRGTGQIVLFHVTANPDWSDLAISGLYVDMLRRILPLAQNRPSQSIESSGDWSPERTLDGFGRLSSPPPQAQSIANDAITTATISASNPPGLYRQGSRRAALNTVQDPNTVERLNVSGLKTAPFGSVKPRSLAGLLLTIAALMLAFDALLALSASGRFNRIRQKFVRSSAVCLAAIIVLALMPIAAEAQDVPNPALELSLAYVETGDTRVDRISQSGLEGLTKELIGRSTIEPGAPTAINLETDNILLYPFLYWPVLRSQPLLSDEVAAKLNAYMAAGGTLVLDTQDADQAALRLDQHPGLQNLIANLDVPALETVPRDHVLNKSFYLLQVYPGRFSEGKVWVDKDQRGTARDGVSSIIVGSNDWASGWAKNPDGRPMTSNDDSMPRQREFAIRFGVNLAMYMLAGNYKSDQVHAAILVERMGEVPEKDMNRMGDEE